MTTLEYCHVSRRVLDDGRPVGYLVRDALGWSFLAGDETQEYVDRPGNLVVRALGEIVARDPAVAVHLSAPVGTALVRAGDGFVDPADRPDPARALNPDFPVVSGTVTLSPEWTLTVEQPMNRRLEDGALVLWRPGFTVWLTLWNSTDAPGSARMATLLEHASPDRYDLRQWRRGEVEYAGYRLTEPEVDAAADPLYGFAVGPGGHLQFAGYFDDEADLAAAGTLLASVTARTVESD